VDLRSYIQDLEERLRQMVFDADNSASSQGAVLLVRGALAGGDHARAAELADATASLARTRPQDSNMMAAATHTRGLLERDCALLDRAACAYTAPLARAQATEDAALALASAGDRGNAVTRLRRAYQQYEEQGCADGMARVRSQLRQAGVRVRHWRRAQRPAFGWDSLTEAERQIAELVAQGLSNREVAGQLFLSAHTVAFHLRHIFDKLDISSRVQLARMVAEQAS
jgi:DNA-binding CsgD family transcriptional regulator